jgi:hypothetical protein
MTCTLENPGYGPATETAVTATFYGRMHYVVAQALTAGVSVFEVARVMGTSVRMVERHYGALLDGATARIASRLDAFDADHDRATAEDAQDV